MNDDHLLVKLGLLAAAIKLNNWQVRQMDDQGIPVKWSKRHLLAVIVMMWVFAPIIVIGPLFVFDPYKYGQFIGNVGIPAIGVIGVIWFITWAIRADNRKRRARRQFTKTTVIEVRHGRP